MLTASYRNFLKFRRRKVFDLHRRLAKNGRGKERNVPRAFVDEIYPGYTHNTLQFAFFVTQVDQKVDHGCNSESTEAERKTAAA